jgi:hypothetical protein
MRAAITGCGKAHSGGHFKGFVSGHDFSHAEKANQIKVGL